MKFRRKLYGFFDHGDVCLSRAPPDVPVPCQRFNTLAEAEAAATAAKYDIVWCGYALLEHDRQRRMANNQTVPPQ